MIFLPADTWIRLVLWMLIGLDIYSHYGIRHSHLEPTGENGAERRGVTVLNALGLALSVLCVITGFWHQQTAGWATDKTMLVLAILIASPISSTSSCDSGTTPARADNFFIITYSKSRQTPVFAGSFGVCYRNFCQDV